MTKNNYTDNLLFIALVFVIAYGKHLSITIKYLWLIKNITHSGCSPANYYI